MGEQRSKQSLQQTPVSILLNGDVEMLACGFAMCIRWLTRSEWCLKLVGSGLYSKDVGLRHRLQWLGSVRRARMERESVGERVSTRPTWSSKSEQVPCRERGLTAQTSLFHFWVWRIETLEWVKRKEICSPLCTSCSKCTSCVPLKWSNWFHYTPPPQLLGYTRVVGGASGGRWDDTRFPDRERYPGF